MTTTENTETLRFIGDGVNLPDAPIPADVTSDDVLTIYRSMVFLRTFDERAVSLQRQGRIGTYPMFWGEEATQAGPFHATESTDWLFPSYRQTAIVCLRGLPPSTIYRYRRGYGGDIGFFDPRQYRVAPITIAIGTHLPHAVGAGWAAKMKGDPIASMVWFGDGSTSEGDFHEAMNFAAVFKTPTVFFCTNNQWAISTHVTKQMAVTAVVQKAPAYGMPGIRVDGFDPVACHVAAKRALEGARAGAGPTLIEAFCYRLAPHGTADDPSKYRDEAITERWRALEPVGRTAAYLKRTGILDDDADETIHTEARDRIKQAVKELEAIDPPTSDALFDHVYASGKPWTLSEAAAEASRG